MEGLLVSSKISTLILSFEIKKDLYTSTLDKTMTSIYEACRDGKLRELQQLISTGKRTDTKDNVYHRTPLQWAMLSAQLPIVNYLLQLNIQQDYYDLLMEHRDIDNKTAKEYAIEHKIANNPNLLLALNHWKKTKFCAFLEADETPRKECSWTYMRTKMMQVSTHVLYHNERVSDRYPLCSETIHADLEHHSRKTGYLKWSLPVDKIHHQLRTDLKHMDNIDGNMLVADLTFEFKIDNQPNYQSITMPIKITGRSIFTITDAHELVQASARATSAYDILEPLYTKGKEASHCQGVHGQDPQYHSTNPSLQQFKNHSEQALATYLSTPTAAKQLVYRFINRLHEQGLPANPSIKIYMIALHIHSDKTPCGACERVLVGVQNSVTENQHNRGRYFGFVEQLEAALLKKNEICLFRLPSHVGHGKTGGLRCYITSSADGTDATHRTHYGVHRAQSVLPTSIETSNQRAATHLHMARFQPRLQIPMQATQPNLSDRTLFASASKHNKKTPEKEASYKKLSASEQDDVGAYFARMGLG